MLHNHFDLQRSIDMSVGQQSGASQLVVKCFIEVYPPTQQPACRAGRELWIVEQSKFCLTVTSNFKFVYFHIVYKVDY